MTETLARKKGGAGFAADLREKLSPVQGGLKQLLAEWGSPGSASELDRMSGAGIKICWQVFKVARAEDVVEEAGNVPTPLSLKRLLAAAKEAGVSEGTVGAVVKATGDFKAFSKVSATDRAAFDSMLAGAQTEGSGGSAGGKIHLAQRRATYRGMSHIDGVQLDLMYMGTMVRRVGKETTEAVSVMSQRGLRRLRPDAQVVLMGTHRAPSGASDDERTWLDPESAAAYGFPLLPQFSKAPFPQAERLELASGFTIFQLVGSEVGSQGSIDFTMGNRGRGPLVKERDGRRMYFSAYAYTRKPVAMGIHELLIHRESFAGVRPELMVYKYLDNEHSHESVSKLQQYPVEEKLERIGRADSVRLGEVPQYREMLEFGAGKAGWDLSEFDVWRVKMPYPIMYSAVRIWFYVD